MLIAYDPQLFGYRAGSHPLYCQFPDPFSVNASPAPFIDAIGLGDPRSLLFPANVVLEFRHCAQDRERQLARAAGVDGLVDALERNALGVPFEIVNSSDLNAALKSIDRVTRQMREPSLFSFLRARACLKIHATDRLLRSPLCSSLHISLDPSRVSGKVQLLLVKAEEWGVETPTNELGRRIRRPGGMRACPAGDGKGACACTFVRFPTSGFGRRPEWT